jgi:hypothetical protein
MVRWCTRLICSLHCLLLSWSSLVPLVIARMKPKVAVGLLIMVWLVWLVGSAFTCVAAAELAVVGWRQ